MILVDTSAWIDWLREGETDAARTLDRILANAVPFAITGVIYQEILQGARSQASFERLADYFGSQRFHEPVDRMAAHREAAALYRRCRAAGVTIRSTIDCFIAQLAIEQDLVLLHADRDFDRLAEHAPALRLYAS
jgi:hypothetical protein